MLTILLLLVFLSSALSCFVFSKLAVNLKLLALPGEHRQHQKPTPMVGGIGIYLGLLVGITFIDKSSYYLLPCLFVLFAVGLLDDRYKLPSWLRFIAQGLAAYAMVILTGVELTSLGNLVSDSEVLLHRWSTPLTVFAVIGVINAVNMSDGLDGLAASLVVLILVALLFLGSPDPGLILVTIASLAGFLVWNLRVGRAQAAIFMGDSGSTVLGLLVAYILINFSQVEHGLPPVTALWLLALPLMDAVALLLVRPMHGRSPFSADRIHYHHQLLDKGLGANATLIIAVFLQLIFIVIGALMWFMGGEGSERVQFYLFLGIFAFYFMFLFHRAKDI